MREPVNRTILLLDIAGSSGRDDVVKAVLRRSLNAVVNQTVLAAGAEATQQYREDRGDGLIVLLDGNVAKTAVLRALLTTTPELLHEHNRLASAGSQMRLRIVLAAGEVTYDPHDGTVGGLVGHDLDRAFRLLDSDFLRNALTARAGEPCVLLVSGAVYDGVVRHGHRGVRPELFQRAPVAVKDSVLTGWLYSGNGTVQKTAGQDAGTSLGSAPAAAASATPALQRPAGAVFHFHGAPVVHGSIVGGDQHGVSGGHVTGDVILGGTVAGSEGSAGNAS
ncbi:hypothetical protein [Kitasatospora sp. NBC_01266]|uniref:hypothetical protein n=1 Tax=Kitasatospora sp. NBC_01266 TaxID=2903572 RepID=UPI002E30E8E0|nr:hypothetical protein [Kitasatospora sp. NBC_01266]